MGTVLFFVLKTDLFTGYHYVVFKAYISFYRIDGERILVDRVLYGKSEYLRKLGLL